MRIQAALKANTDAKVRSTREQGIENRFHLQVNFIEDGAEKRGICYYGVRSSRWGS